MFFAICGTKRFKSKTKEQKSFISKKFSKNFFSLQLLKDELARNFKKGISCISKQLGDKHNSTFTSSISLSHSHTSDALAHSLLWSLFLSPTHWYVSCKRSHRDRPKRKEHLCQQDLECRRRRRRCCCSCFEANCFIRAAVRWELKRVAYFR